MFGFNSANTRSDNADLDIALAQIERDATLNDPRNRASYDPKKAVWLRDRELRDKLIGCALLLGLVGVSVVYLLIFS